jgi:hypothetical protein
MTSAVSGRYSRSSCRTPRRQPPRTAGSQPALPVLEFSQRTAYRSVRAPNNAPKNATFSAADDLACTGPGADSNHPDWTGPGTPASCGESLSSRSNRAFSTRNCSTSVRRPASSVVRSCVATLAWMGATSTRPQYEEPRRTGHPSAALAASPTDGRWGRACCRDTACDANWRPTRQSGRRPDNEVAVEPQVARGGGGVGGPRNA